MRSGVERGSFLLRQWLRRTGCHVSSRPIAPTRPPEGGFSRREYYSKKSARSVTTPGAQSFLCKESRFKRENRDAHISVHMRHCLRSIFSTRKTPKRLRVRNRAYARLTALRRRRFASLRLEPSPPHHHHPAGLPVSDATRKFALRAKDTELRALIRVLRPQGEFQ